MVFQQPKRYRDIQEQSDKQYQMQCEGQLCKAKKNVHWIWQDSSQWCSLLKFFSVQWLVQETEVMKVCWEEMGNEKADGASMERLIASWPGEKMWRNSVDVGGRNDGIQVWFLSSQVNGLNLCSRVNLMELKEDVLRTCLRRPRGGTDQALVKDYAWVFRVQLRFETMNL